MSPADAGIRLDVWLSRQNLEITRSQIRRWIDQGRVTVNDRPVKSGHLLRAGDDVAWEPPEPVDSALGPEPEAIPLRIVHRDPDIVVVDKAPGMVVHPGAGVTAGTLVGALKGAGVPLATMGSPTRPGIVHRLDKGTSGLMVVASTDRAYHLLVKAIAARQVHRRYRALVWGVLELDRGEFSGAIGRSRADRRRMTVVKSGGREAVTHFQVRKRYGFLTDLDLELETGRTHQIRVHCRHEGHPVFGDPEYGGRSRTGNLPAAAKERAREWLALIERQALHAGGLQFDHPVTGGRLSFEAPFPEDLARLYEAVARGSQ